MLSVVMVGRNDDYGVDNLRSTFLALREWTQRLDLRQGDELVFVDFASPTEETLPEAIHREYCLDPRSRKLIKVLRVDAGEVPELERIFNQKALMPLLEPIARNVGIRASRGDWILSTNTDVVPLGILYPWVRLLKVDNWYLSQPFLIPIETWKASLDPLSWVAEAPLIYLRTNAPKIPGVLPFAKVGDFQLAPRAMWWAVRGFEEQMSFLWGLSDANLCAKVSRLGEMKVLTEMLPVCHLEHSVRILETGELTQGTEPGQGSHFSQGAPQNDWYTWITSFLEKGAETSNRLEWGQVPFKEIRL